MSATLKNQERLQSAPRPLTRRVERRPSNASVLVQSSHGDHVKARLRDISIFGCNLLSDADWLRMGQFLSIRPPASEPIQAIVRWVRGGSCGVEFLRPISHERAEALTDRWD